MAPDDDPAAAEAQEELILKKPPGTWTPSETLHLIDAYQDKWYALKRGQLRTCHWNEVAQSLAASCGGHPEATHKSSMQCRHKLEKLRRRYRAERQLLLRKPSSRASSSWPFFQRMDLLERGPVAAAEAASTAKSSLPLKFANPRGSQDQDSAMSDDENAEGSDPPPIPRVFSNRRRRNHHQNPRQEVLYDEDDDGSRSPFTRKRGVYEVLSAASFDKMEELKNLRKVSEKTGRAGFLRMPETNAFLELISVVRSLGEGFIRMEQMKLQVQREMEQFRAEMQMRRAEMLIDSQKQISDLFAKALINSKKGKESQSPHNPAGSR